MDRASPGALERDASTKPVPRRVTGTGVVTYDETRTAHIGVPVHGWLEKVRTKSVGRRVRRFEALAVVYSPEVYLASLDLIAQLRDFTTQERLNQERWRLVRWGMPKPNLDQIENQLAPSAPLPLVTRVAGTVVAEHGAPAQLVDPDNSVEYFTVTDPARYWAFVDVPDEHVALLRVGMPATLTVEGAARPLTAKIAYIFRRPDEGMRRLRFDVYSPHVVLKPNAAVHAELSPSGR